MNADALILNLDYPDPDVIRVGDAYYMISTTMHFMPGAEILRSFDLVHWEHYSYVYERLDGTPGQRLEGDLSIYGQGMWAASLRLHDGVYHVCFVANDTGRTYLFRALDLRGPWEKSYIEGFYHDCSLLFDGGSAYLVYGNTEIWCTELRADLSGPKEGGLHRVIIRDEPGRRLGYEGAHAYKIGGFYYVFLIHWLSDGSGRRVQACFRSDSLTGRFEGRDVLDDDLGYLNQGVAQGGIVDTPQGEWYAILFQDRGAVGRIPVLAPLRWEDGFPVLGEGGSAPLAAGAAGRADIPVPRRESGNAPLVSSDDFRYEPGAGGKAALKGCWQWNHESRDELWSIDAERGRLELRSGRLSENVTRAHNVLTQRALFPSCSASVSVEGGELRDGDFAGICALQGRYGMVALAREGGELFLVMRGRPGGPDYEMGQTLDKEPGVEYGRVPWRGGEVELRVDLNFADMRDEARFSYREAGGEWRGIGAVQKLYFGLDHFVGCRIGLFIYSTKSVGGRARFAEFSYGAPSPERSEDKETR
jgi:beta-xylosidase